MEKSYEKGNLELAPGSRDSWRPERNFFSPFLSSRWRRMGKSVSLSSRNGREGLLCGGMRMLRSLRSGPHSAAERGIYSVRGRAAGLANRKAGEECGALGGARGKPRRAGSSDRSGEGARFPSSLLPERSFRGLPGKTGGFAAIWLPSSRGRVILAPASSPLPPGSWRGLFLREPSESGACERERERERSPAWDRGRCASQSQVEAGWRAGRTTGD